MKIVLTNWINLLGVSLAVVVYTTFANYFIESAKPSLFQSFLSALLLVFLYGLVFLIGLLLALIVLDLILIIPNKSFMTIKLLIEWLLISLPFIYWAVIYERQRGVYTIAIVALFITQVIRKRFINKVLNAAQG